MSEQVKKIHVKGQVSKRDLKRQKASSRIIFIGSVVNILLSVIKILFGYLGGSYALIADGVHSFSDLITDMMAYFGTLIGGKPMDSTHSYGHGKIEDIFTFLIGCILFVTSISILVSGTKRLTAATVEPPEVYTLIIVLLSILSKEALFRATLVVGKRHNNNAVIANAWHHRSDALSSVAAFVGIGGAIIGFPVMDPLSAIVVGLFIMKASYDLVKDTLSRLTDMTLPEPTLKKIDKIILDTEGVKHYHMLKTRKSGGFIWIDVHVMVDEKLSVSEGHNIAERVRRRLINELKMVADVMVHIDAENDVHGVYYDLTRSELDDYLSEVTKKYSDKIELLEYSLHFLYGKILVYVFLVDRSGSSDIKLLKDVAGKLKREIESHKKIDKVEIFFKFD